MKIEIYNRILEYLKETINGTGFEGHLYSVGGCERDKHIGLCEIKDIDLVLDIQDGGIRFAKWLEENGLTEGSVVVYENFGTAMFRLKEFPTEEIESVQTRKESYRNKKSRCPKTCYGTMEDDASRRDFTINDLYHNISTGEELDPSGRGIDDIRNRTIDTCGDPDIIFTEDPLRIMRAVRFAARLNYRMSLRTIEGIKKHRDRLNIVSQERITDEFNKIITGFNASYGVTILSELGIFPYIMPEFEWDHDTNTVYLISYLQKCERNLKPEVNKLHMMLSIFSIWFNKRTFKDVMIRMKYSSADIASVYFYASNAYHFKLVESEGYQILRRIEHMCKTNEIYANLFYVADIAYDLKWTTSDDVYTAMVPESIHPMIGYSLPVDGNDIMEILEIAPSKEVKVALDCLASLVHVIPDLTRGELIKIIKEYKACN